MGESLMKFTVNQREFSEALNIASKAMVSKTALDILKGFYIEAYDGSVVVTGNNLEVGIKTKIPAFIETEGKCIVDSRVLFDIVRKLPNEQIHIKVENGTVLIKCLKSKFMIKEMFDNGYPTVEELEDAVYQSIDSDVLYEMIRKTHFAVSLDETKPVFMGELLEIDENKVNLVALDGYRLAYKQCEIDSSIGYQKILIPGKTMSEIMKLSQNIGEQIKIGLEERHASFIFGNTLVNTQLIQGEFAKYQEIIPSEFATTVKVDREKFMSSLDRASLVSNNYLVKLDIRNDELLITAHDNEIGNLEESLDIEMEGKELEIAFNLRYFMDALKVMEDEFIYLKFNSNVSPCVVIPENEEGYTYLLLPVRI